MISTAAIINIITTAAIVNPNGMGGGGNLANAITEQIQLNGSGIGSLTLANADTYEVLAIWYDTAVADQSQVERYDKSNTTAIKVQSQSAIGAGNNKYVNITYILASEM